MKKTIIAIATVMFLASCGGSTEQTTTDSTIVVTPGDDSSMILPPLTDSAKADTVTVGKNVTSNPE